MHARRQTIPSSGQANQIRLILGEFNYVPHRRRGAKRLNFLIISFCERKKSKWLPLLVDGRVALCWRYLSK